MRTLHVRPMSAGFLPDPPAYSHSPVTLREVNWRLSVGVNVSVNGCLSLWAHLHLLASSRYGLWVFTPARYTLARVTISH